MLYATTYPNAICITMTESYYESHIIITYMDVGYNYDSNNTDITDLLIKTKTALRNYNYVQYYETNKPYMLW